MSKHINVNPGQYKEGGREHQGDQVLHAVNKQQFAQAEKAKEENSVIPNQDKEQNPAAGGGENRAGEATSSANSSSSNY